MHRAHVRETGVQVIGTLREIWRYPVKGMAGESLQAAQIGPDGVAGDRRWAVRETSRREIQSCKRHPRLLQCTARYPAEPRSAETLPAEVTLPGGTKVSTADVQAASAISEVLGAEVSVEPVRPASDVDFYRRFNRGGDGWLQDLIATFAREPGEPLPLFLSDPQVARDFVGVPGSFFLVAPVHIVTTASLRQLRAWNEGADWDARRFRPNLVIETHPQFEGLVEQGWIGRRLTIGGCAIACTETTVRCGAITRPQGGLPSDPTILRTVVRKAEQNVGIYGTIGPAAQVRVGDPVGLA
jgi:uncharacterized protein YcbX